MDAEQPIFQPPPHLSPPTQILSTNA